jgi:coiled-coil domain-containing protein 77
VLKEGEEEKERLLRRIEDLKDDIDLYQSQAAAALRKKAMQVARGPVRLVLCRGHAP